MADHVHEWVPDPFRRGTFDNACRHCGIEMLAHIEALTAQRDRFAADLRWWWANEKHLDDSGWYRYCRCGSMERKARGLEAEWTALTPHAPGCATAEAIAMEEGRDNG